ncbi:alpha/beta fold hydrolase [Kibdelosporangium philippinense]|uniref:Alpha/beta fold hydrolase n=1 Tax=Kibdelosporangium philippinense TaxID=211113 RepID=A0ABS8Z3D3_9PSEU|nr:alpha/beta fold hydrolase [Kibdelosporangium philippinense]MCE7002345.1 alpha/beta fold hydrolase [Kibdelosporangium philippinense]
MRWAWGRAVAVLAIIGMLTGCGAWQMSRRPAEGLAWTACSDEVQCATLTVPVDWRAPEGPITAVNLVRLPATGDRLGSVVVNLGAGNGTNAMLARVPPALRELAGRFDIVVFDPPGLGRADNGTLIRCAPGPSVYGLVIDPSEAGWAAQSGANAAYDKSCREAAGHTYTHLTSWQIAHDLEALRAALGEDRLRYLGNSYGTSYGQAYADLFGPWVERMYLDGVADHTQPDLTAWLTDHARTQEEQLRRFSDWCAASTTCALHGIDPLAVWDKVADDSRAHIGVLIGLTPPRWPDLAAGLAAARDGDFSRFPKDLPPEPVGSVQPALLCHDFMPAMPEYREFLAIERRLREAAPRVGWLAGRMQLGRCVGVTDDPAYPPAPIKPRGLGPVLIGIGELDNNTPHLAAHRVVEQLSAHEGHAW